MSCNNSSSNQKSLDQRPTNNNSNKEKTELVLEEKDYSDSVVNNSPETDSKIREYLQRDDLVIKWYDDLLHKEGKNSTLKSTKIAIENRHDPETHDSIEILSYNNSEIRIYQVSNRNKSILQSSVIRDSIIIISNELHVGLHKTQVQNILDSEFDNDTISVGDLEHATVFTLYFKGDTLKGIDYSGYID